MAVGGKLKGALARDPNMQRLSPGVYRNSQGQLVNSAGRGMRHTSPQPQQQQPQRQDNSWAYQPYLPQQGQGANELAGQYLGAQPSPGEIRNPMTGEMVNLPNPMPIDPGFNIDPGSIVNYPGQLNGRTTAEIIGAVAGQGGGMQGQAQQMPSQMQMPQPSANHSGQYRLSPGVYGTREQAMKQYQDNMTQKYDPYATQNFVPYPGMSVPAQRRR